MSAIKVIVFIPRAADKWLKLESLQTEKLQFLMIGNISLIEKLSSGTHKFLKLEFSIWFNKICSSLFFPVAKKNLHFFIFEIFDITFKKVLEGILFVGPEPPIPKSIFVSFLSILNFFRLRDTHLVKKLL